MTAAMAAAGGLAWLGGALVLLSDGRRGWALGLALAGAGLALVAAIGGDVPDAVPMLGGGVVAGALRLRHGPPGFRLLAPGSAPRIVLCVVGLAAALAAASLSNHRLGPLAVLALAAAPLVGGAGRTRSLALMAAMALAIASLSGGTGAIAGALAAAALGATRDPGPAEVAA